MLGCLKSIYDVKILWWFWMGKSGTPKVQVGWKRLMILLKWLVWNDEGGVYGTWEQWSLWTLRPLLYLYICLGLGLAAMLPAYLYVFKLNLVHSLSKWSMFFLTKSTFVEHLPRCLLLRKGYSYHCIIVYCIRIRLISYITMVLHHLNIISSLSTWFLAFVFLCNGG